MAVLAWNRQGGEVNPWKGHFRGFYGATPPRWAICLEREGACGCNCREDRDIPNRFIGPGSIIFNSSTVASAWAAAS